MSKREAPLDLKEISEHIQNINAALNRHEKRIYEMERTHQSGSKLGISNISDDGFQTISSSTLTNEMQQLQNVMSKVESEWRDNSIKLKEELSRIKEQVQICVKPSEI